MLSPSAERDLITAAKAGDDRAKLALIDAYQPLIRGCIAKFRNVVAREDAEAACALALLEAIRDADPDRTDSIAALVQTKVMQILRAEELIGHAVAVPERMVRRFGRVLQAAGGDANKAAELAPDYDLSTSAFQLIYATLYGAPLAEADLMPADRELVADVEDQILATVALDSMTQQQRDVCLLRYGFDAYDETTLLEAGEQLGMTRAVVYRHHAQALQTARRRLGLLPAE